MNAEYLSLADLLRDWKDGNELGWPTEFAWLWSNDHYAMLMLIWAVANDGIQEPILLGSDGRVWDGHHRIAVAAALGLTEVPVVHAGAVSIERDQAIKVACRVAKSKDSEPVTLAAGTRINIRFPDDWPKLTPAEAIARRGLDEFDFSEFYIDDDEDMTEEQFNDLWAKSEPVELDVRLNGRRLKRILWTLSHPIKAAAIRRRLRAQQ